MAILLIRTPWLLAPEVGTKQEDRLTKSLSGRIVQMDTQVSNSLEERGIMCAGWPLSSGIFGVLDDAAALVRSEATLWSQVDNCVREIVVLTAPNDEYDVSHSEPIWPNRIYVSVPRQSSVSDLRVAEAIVHEAMHLNLTNFERIVPIFMGNGRMFSPWRDCERPVSGVFHGFYVFTCIARFFEHVLLNERSEVRRAFIDRRLAQISEELAVVSRGAMAAHLTSEGVRLWSCLEPL